MKHIIIILILISTNCFAINLGSLDTTFSNDGVTDGWERTGANGYATGGTSIVVDSQGRALIAGSEFFDNSGLNDIRVFVERYLPSGVIDPTFNSQSISVFLNRPDLLGLIHIQIVLDENDGFFLGYSYDNCAGSNCNDTIIYHFNDTGSILGVRNIAFDLGPDVNSKNDKFSEMVYIPTLDKLVVALSVDTLAMPYYDVDFGVAVLNVATDGSLTLDTNFNADGLNTCAFNQDPNFTNEVDTASAIVFNSQQNTVIVAGEAFEGNGAFSSGFNMAFCEFRLTDIVGEPSGTLIEQWSTEPLPNSIFGDDQEYLRDVLFNNDGDLIVAGMLTSASDTNDFALVKYHFDGMDWIIENSFGPNGTGWTTATFTLLDSNFNSVDTNDTVYKLIYESEDGGLLIGGSSSWDDGADSYSAGSFVRFTKNGILDTNWGQNKSGKSLVILDSITKRDGFLDIAEKGVGESIFATGASKDGSDDKRIIAKFHNDLIYGGNFDF